MASVTITYRGAETWGKKDLQDALREQAKAIATSHHRVVTPQKFTRAAARKYGHVKRQKRYIGKKIARVPREINGTRVVPDGSGLDFVFSGYSRETALASRGIKATAASSTRAYGEAIIVANVFNLSKLSDGTSLRKDFEKESDADTQVLARVGGRARERYLARLSTRTKTVTRKG